MPGRSTGAAASVARPRRDGVMTTTAPSSAQLFTNASQVVTCAGAARARRGPEMADAVVRTGVCVAIDGDRIAAVAPLDDLRAQFPAAREIDCRGGVITPGLVDSHTHGVFGRPRYDEQEMRAAGLDYMEIARRGGGIHSSVRDLRTQSEDTLSSSRAPACFVSPRSARRRSR